MPGLNGTKVRGLRQRTVACLILLGVLAPVVVDAVTARAADTTISVENAWSRATPNGAEVAIGFATIKNSSDEADRFISVTTEVAGQTHTVTVTEDGFEFPLRSCGPQGVQALVQGPVENLQEVAQIRLSSKQSARVSGWAEPRRSNKNIA